MDRFEGIEGKRRLIEALLDHKIIKGNQEIAKEISEVGHLLEVNQGDAYIEQDAEDNDLYFILTGSSEVVINGRTVASREPGMHVGEMALIDHTAKRSATVRTTEKSILLRLSEEKFTLIANKFPHLWRSIATELAGRLRQRGLKIKAPNSSPEFFIGSSAEQLDIANAIQSSFAHENVSAVVWTNKVFGASKTPIESLMMQLERTDFAVLVLGEDDIIQSRGEESSGPRDNVVFELGLFIGKLGRDRVFMVCKRGLNIKIPTDLIGVHLLEYNDAGTNLDAKLGPACHEMKKVIKELGTL